MKVTTYKCEVCNNPKVQIEKISKKKQSSYSFVSYCEICRVLRTFIQKV